MGRSVRYVRFQLVGWVLFLACAVLFLYVAIRDRDAILALASFVFLGGCVVFLIPLIIPGQGKEAAAEGEGSDSPAER